MIHFVIKFWTKSIRRQLMLGIAMVHAILMTIFVVDLVGREHDFLIKLSHDQAVGLAETLAANGSSWVLSNDYIGMEEVISSQSQFPDLRYAIFTDLQGQVLGFTDRTKVGLHMSDYISKKLLNAPVQTQTLIDNEYEIDIATPILSANQHIGWARVGLSRENILANLSVVTQNGLYYTLFAIIIGILFAWSMSKGLTLGIKKLLTNAERVEKGEIGVDFYLERDDELGHLADAMNATTKTLDRNQQQLKQHKQELENKVNERTKELTSVNEELKNFAYVVSHDLKAPLRAINQLASWIEEDYAHAFDDDGREQMSLLRNRAKRMHAMIDGILQYSRIGRLKATYESINLNLLFIEIIDTVVPPEHISVQIEDDLPTVIADKVSLFQVLQNLLDNAIKYNDKDYGLVQFDVNETLNEWIFFVKDNGMGIDKEDQKEVFQLFRTLSPKDEQNSTGVGLSLIEKSINHWGGNITLESELDQGCLFTFTLPKKRTKL